MSWQRRTRLQSWFIPIPCRDDTSDWLQECLLRQHWHKKWLSPESNTSRGCSKEYIQNYIWTCHFMNSQRLFQQPSIENFRTTQSIRFFSDVILFSKTLAEHQEHFDKVVEEFQKTHLVISGYLSSRYIQIGKHSFQRCYDGPSKVKSYPRMAKFTHCSWWSFLGLCIRLIQKFKKIAPPLHDLTYFCLGPKRIKAFKTLKITLTIGPILFLRDLRSHLYYDVILEPCSTNIGAVLEQDGHVLAYESQCLKPMSFMLSLLGSIIFLVSRLRKIIKVFIISYTRQGFRKGQTSRPVFHFQILHVIGIKFGSLLSFIMRLMI